MPLRRLNHIGFKFYHVTDRERLPSIRRNGIRPSKDGCPSHMTPQGFVYVPSDVPGRDLAVFATDRVTQKRFGSYHSEDVPWAVVEFEVDQALIDKGFPSIVVAPKDSVYEKTISNIEEIKARKGPMILVATEGDNSIFKYSKNIVCIPQIREELSPILAVIPLQLFAYHMAVLRGTDVDKPRNLAKSVTVE